MLGHLLIWKEYPKTWLHTSLTLSQKLVPPGKRNALAGERSKAVNEEVDQLVKAMILRESLLTVWISNPVLVMKGDRSWCMCVDYTSLNKSCPKD